MNIVMYGFELDAAWDILEKYGFTLCRNHTDFDRTGNGILLQSRISSEEEKYEFFNSWEDFADNIDTVIVPLSEGMSDVGHCCTQPWKLFVIDTSDEPEYEISRIIESHLGLICAHEGI